MDKSVISYMVDVISLSCDNESSFDLYLIKEQEAEGNWSLLPNIIISLSVLLIHSIEESHASLFGV